MFTSKKSADEIKVTEPTSHLINEQCVVYEYKYDLCDAGYVGYTCQHLNSILMNLGILPLRDVNLRTKDLCDSFTMLKKCHGKLDCLIYEMLFIKDKTPTLTCTTQSDSNKAELFIWQFKHIHTFTFKPTYQVNVCYVCMMCVLYNELRQCLIWIWEWWHKAIKASFFNIAAFYF